MGVFLLCPIDLRKSSKYQHFSIIRVKLTVIQKNWQEMLNKIPFFVTHIKKNCPTSFISKMGQFSVKLHDLLSLRRRAW